MNWTRKLEVVIENLQDHHKNIRTLKALENLVENLDRIPIDEIEKLTDKYTK